MTHLRYHHVSVFLGANALSSEQMLAITQEMRHFESIFLESTDDARRFRARVFDLVEELDFAGHPIIGAASVVHSVLREGETAEWIFELNRKTVTVTTRRTPGGF